MRGHLEKHIALPLWEALLLTVSAWSPGSEPAVTSWPAVAGPSAFIAAAKACRPLPGSQRIEQITMLGWPFPSDAHVSYMSMLVL